MVQYEIIKILDQDKARDPEWYEAMVNPCQVYQK
jgi:hypothetical protein